MLAAIDDSVIIFLAGAGCGLALSLPAFLVGYVRGGAAGRRELEARFDKFIALVERVGLDPRTAAEGVESHGSGGRGDSIVGYAASRPRPPRHRGERRHEA
jgi:hypothetical protein